MRLAELIGTLSLATDAGTGAPEDHGLKAGILAAKLGEYAQASDRERADAYYLALLKYSGCTAEGHMATAMFGDEIEFGLENQGADWGDAKDVLPRVLRHARKGKGTFGGIAAMARVFGKLPGMPAVQKAHCEVAALLARRLGFDEEFQAAISQINERWNGGGPNKAKGEAIARAMRLAHVGEDIEVGHRCHGGFDGAMSFVGAHAGKGLDPKLVDVFKANAKDILATIEAPSIWAAAMDAEPKPHREVVGPEIDEALLTMSTFADLKSRYTRGHSAHVANLAADAAKHAGFNEEVQTLVRRAALLHDIGRVAITAGIWDKATPLSDLEREKIRMHTYIGERVLARAPSLALVADVASLAHERLDGTGYHRRLAAAACPPASRLLAAADVYRALVEERPHRAARSPIEAATELQAMADSGALCPDATRAVLAAAGHTPKKVERAHGLTDREVEVLRLVARGLTNKEIATTLDISTKTAGHHVQNVFGKLKVTTRAAAAIHAITLGITA